jgi:sulfatase maturation enzyme AslB (radical SAM superfamily)
MNRDTASFCALPWVHMNVNPDGAATLCCQSHHRIHAGDGGELNLQTHSLQEIWNSEGMKDIRRKMSAGENLPHCEACYNNERFGRASYRQHSNQRWLQDETRAEAIRQSIDRSSDGFALHSPGYFDLRLGNICNLKCTACKPLYSSQIERDAVHSKWITDAPYHRLAHRFATAGDWSEADELADEIVAMAGELSLIQLAGGEPTINKTQMALLRRLADSGKAREIDLEVVTNLSSVRDEIYDLFASFRSLSIGLSIDGCEATYEYVRYPGKWSALLRNVARLRERCPGVRMSINAVLQAVNAVNVIDLFGWADEAGIQINLSIGRGLDHFNDFRILPPSLRAAIRADFEAYFLRRSNQNVQALRQNIRSVFDEMDATEFAEADRRARSINFMHFVNDMDTSRRLSFRQLAPAIHDALGAEIGHWAEETRFA